jgi:signal transduction histidine kinase
VGLQPARNKNALALLGADIRNDLNNPLQEIVAMAFVATSSSQLSATAEEALGAIQRAATSMASVINSLEDKIRTAVTETQPLRDERSLR